MLWGSEGSEVGEEERGNLWKLCLRLCSSTLHSGGGWVLVPVSSFEKNEECKTIFHIIMSGQVHNSLQKQKALAPYSEDVSGLIGSAISPSGCNQLQVQFLCVN